MLTVRVASPVSEMSVTSRGSLYGTGMPICMLPYLKRAAPGGILVKKGVQSAVLADRPKITWASSFLESSCKATAQLPQISPAGDRVGRRLASVGVGRRQCSHDHWCITLALGTMAVDCIIRAHRALLE
jgi:hypothetical protein